MKTPLATGILLAGLALFIAGMSRSNTQVAPDRNSDAARPFPHGPSPRTSPPVTSSGVAEGDAAQAPRAMPDEISIAQKISDAAANYDEGAVKTIAPYLLNPNKEIRRIAVDALIRAGCASGATELRDAAKKMNDPREASAFLDAADFLNLPSASAQTEPPAKPPAAGALGLKGNR